MDRQGLCKTFLQCISDWIAYAGGQLKTKEDEPSSADGKERKRSTNSWARLSTSTGMNNGESVSGDFEGLLEGPRRRRSIIAHADSRELINSFNSQQSRRSTAKDTNHGRTRKILDYMVREDRYFNDNIVCVVCRCLHSQRAQYSW